MTLGTRMAAVVGVVVAAAITAAAAGSYVATRAELQATVDQDLLRRAGVAQGSPSQVRRFLAGGPRNFSGLVQADVIVQFVDARARVEAAAEGNPVLPVGDRARELLAAAPRVGRAFDTVNAAGESYRVLTLALPSAGGIQLARSLADSQEVLAGLRTRLLVLALVASAVAAGVVWWATRRATRPIWALTAAAEEVAATQDPAAPMATPATGDDEVARLTRSFNTMLEALATSRSQQRQLVRDASHELRTPLTSLRTNLELAARATDMAAEDRRQLLEAATAELAELSHLVSEITTLATDGASEEPLGAVDLAAVAEEVAARFRRRGRQVNVITSGSTEVTARPMAIERAVVNLVDNACKFSPPDTPVDIRVEPGSLVVEDQGPGIPAEERPLVFDRFHRAPASRSLPGSGLGLAIVAQVVADLGGRTTVGDSPSGGAAVGFTLGGPLSSDPGRGSGR